MPVQAITSKIISTLGNKESLIPIMLKDGVDSASLTYKSYKEGGIVEGKDRAIDEFGTQAIWIGGIPFFKKIFDMTAYKASKINPEVDVRIIADKEYSKWAKENAQGIMSNSKTQSVKQAINDCLADGGKKVKNLYKGKIIAATALTLGTYFLLTKLKQKNTKNTVIKNMQDELHTINKKPEYIKNSVFSDIEKAQSTNKPSFKGITKSLTEAIMFNPVHNMKIIDAGITTERLACSRNKTELAEHAIKEGSFLFFLYGFGNLIEKGINKFANKKLNKPIDLPIDVIMDDNFAKALQKNTIVTDTKKFAQNNTLTEKLNFIKNNPDNILVQAAKKAKIVSTIKKGTAKEVVDTSKYINIKDLDTLSDNLKNINDKFSTSKDGVNKFLSKTKALKVVSVMANIGISCLFLGYIVPKAVYMYRESKLGSTKFHVEEDIKKGKNQ